MCKSTPIQWVNLPATGRLRRVTAEAVIIAVVLARLHHLLVCVVREISLVDHRVYVPWLRLRDKEDKRTFHLLDGSSGRVGDFTELGEERL